jgi:hypothetical protein
MEEVEIQEKSPEEIIRENIDKANILLDHALGEVESGVVTARMIEVTARVIDTITSAADKLIMAQNESLGLLFKQDMLKLKEKEILLRGKAEHVSIENLTQQNIIVKSREDLLKLMQEDPNIIDIGETRQ